MRQRPRPSTSPTREAEGTRRVSPPGRRTRSRGSRPRREHRQGRRTPRPPSARRTRRAAGRDRHRRGTRTTTSASTMSHPACRSRYSSLTSEGAARPTRSRVWEALGGYSARQWRRFDPAAASRVGPALSGVAGRMARKSGRSDGASGSTHDLCRCGPGRLRGAGRHPARQFPLLAGRPTSLPAIASCARIVVARDRDGGGGGAHPTDSIPPA